MAQNPKSNTPVKHSVPKISAGDIVGLAISGVLLLCFALLLLLKLPPVEKVSMNQGLLTCLDGFQLNKPKPDFSLDLPTGEGNYFVSDSEYYFSDGNSGSMQVIDNGDGTITVIYNGEQSGNNGQQSGNTSDPGTDIPGSIAGSWMSYSENPLGLSVSTRTFLDDGSYDVFSDAYEYGSAVGWHPSGLADSQDKGSYTYENGELRMFDKLYYIPPNLADVEGASGWVPSNAPDSVYQVTISADGNTLFFWNGAEIAFKMIRVHGSTSDMLNTLYPNGPEHELYG